MSQFIRDEQSRGILTHDEKPSRHGLLCIIGMWDNAECR